MQNNGNMGSTNAAFQKFKDYISEKMLAVESQRGRSHITAAELAESLGFSIKVFLEILNGRRSGPDRRDFIIALCAQLGLDSEETTEALYLYPGCRQLFKDDERDKAISEFLNAGFDTEISYANLNRFLSDNGLPPLKIRYRSPSPTDDRRNIPVKTIDWHERSANERNRYYYYTSLGYDDKVASVLALFTYGSKRIPEFSMQDAFDAFADGSRYPRPEPPRQDERYSYRRYSESVAPKAPLKPTSVTPNPYMELEDDAELPFDSPSPAKAKYSVPHRPSLKRQDMLFSLPFGDEYEPIEEKGHQDPITESSSNFRMTTNTASAGIVLNQLRNNRTITKDMVRIEEWLNYFRYQTAKPEAEMFRVSHEVKYQDNGNALLYVNVQGKEEEKEQQNIVLLLDVSGSMSSHAIKTQAAAATIISKLQPGSTFSLVTYGPDDRVVLNGYKVTSYESKVRILEKLLGLEIDGYTNGSAGIERAYQIGRENYLPGGNNQVILITDGDLNFGIVDKGGLEQLIEEEKKSNLFLSVLGIGLTNFKDDKLEVLSKHGNGVYRVINNFNDIKKCVRDEYTSLVNIIAKDVKAQVEFNPELVSSYRLLGFENRGISHAEFKDDSVISEPFGSGGYGIALYELKIKDAAEPVVSELKYRKVITTGSDELATVRVRYKEPLEEKSHQLEYVIPSVAERYSDNLLLAWVVYVCAEKLRDSEKITPRDEAVALSDYEHLGKDIKLLNFNDIDKLREILQQSKETLNIGRQSRSRYEW